MKIKVNFFDKQLREEYNKFLGGISLLFSFLSVCLPLEDINQKIRYIAILIILLISSYVILWIIANVKTTVKIKVNNSILEIKIGDIFKEDNLKVIAFNEYFDTKVDQKIISDKTLNGKYINKNINDIGNLDKDIKEYLDSRNLEVQINNGRNNGGKTEKYRLGTIVKNKEYLLTAFSKFDDDDRAYLFLEDYVQFLLNFWNEVDIIYNGNSVSIPLLGSGITRFRGYELISNQELLELMIWSFKVSKLKFAYSSKIKIIIYNDDKDKINFYKLKKLGTK